jgi:hypothetical protein
MVFPDGPYEHTGEAKRGKTRTQSVWNEVGDNVAALTSALLAGGLVDARLVELEAKVAEWGGAVERGLEVRPGATSASQVRITATELGVEGYLLRDVDVTCDLTVHGKGGFDNLTADPEDASTLYYPYVTYNPSSKEVAAVFSKSPTRAGVNPSGAHSSLAGFTAYRRTGSAFNDGSSNLVPFRMVGERSVYQAGVSALQVFGADLRKGSTSSGAAPTDFETVTLPALPPFARLVLLTTVVGFIDATNGAGRTARARPTGTTHAGRVIAYTPPITGGALHGVPVYLTQEAECSASQQLDTWWDTRVTGAPAGANLQQLTVSGFVDAGED